MTHSIMSPVAPRTSPSPGESLHRLHLPVSCLAQPAGCDTSQNQPLRNINCGDFSCSTIWIRKRRKNMRRVLFCGMEVLQVDTWGLPACSALTLHQAFLANLFLANLFLAHVQRLMTTCIAEHTVPIPSTARWGGPALGSPNAHPTGCVVDYNGSATPVHATPLVQALGTSVERKVPAKLSQQRMGGWQRHPNRLLNPFWSLLGCGREGWRRPQEGSSRFPHLRAGVVLL